MIGRRWGRELLDALGGGWSGHAEGSSTARRILATPRRQDRLPRPLHRRSSVDLGVGGRPRKRCTVGSFFFWNAAGGIAWACRGRPGRLLRRPGGRSTAIEHGLCIGVDRDHRRRGSIVRRPPRRSGSKAETRSRARAVVVLLLVACGSASMWTPPAKAPASTTCRLPARRGRRLREPRGDRDRRLSRRADVPALGDRYATLTSYDGVTHPSLPNYLALVSGSTHGITSDCVRLRRRRPQPRRHARRREGRRGRRTPRISRRRATPAGVAGDYAKKHDPFLYFRDIAEHPARARNVVPRPRLAARRRARVSSPTSRSSSRISATTCTTAPSRPATRGSRPRRAARRLACARAAASSSSSSTRGRPTRAAADASYALALGPTVKAHSVFARRPTTTACSARSRTPGICRGSGFSAKGTPIGGIWRR